VTRSAGLWAVAVVVTLAAAAWQRRTGPSYPYEAVVPLGGTPVRVSLLRSHLSTSAARVAVPAPDTVASGALFWRRYPTGEPFTVVPLRREGDALAAALPVQPPAGKVEYFLEVADGGAPVRIPEGVAVVLRYCGPVPAYILAPHIAIMFLGLLVGARAGLGAALGDGEQRTLVLTALAAFTFGGLVLGSITQKHAFGAWWTGVPFGWDLTDNKTLLMWIGWAVAGQALARRRTFARWLVVAAAVLMLAAYVVPHSAKGSQLDYTRVPSPSARSSGSTTSRCHVFLPRRAGPGSLHGAVRPVRS